jgi:hypothetical protein
MAKSKKTESDTSELQPLVSRVNPEKFHNTKADDYRTVYSNNVAFAVSAFDVSLIFGEIAGVEADALEVIQRVRITMSPQQAKVLAKVLVENLKAYEEKIGVIPIPPALLMNPSNAPGKEN